MEIQVNVYRAFGARLVRFLVTYSPAFLVLLLPALFNRFPLVFSDTGTYLAAAMKPFIPVDRPIHYSVLLYALHLRQTLWPIVVAQAALTIAVLAILFDVSLRRLRVLHMAALVAIIAATSALPVLVSEVMPDLFTPLLICSLVILALYSPALTNVRKVFLYTIVLLAICVHQANFLIASAMLLTLTVARSRLKPRLAGPWLAVCAGSGLLVAPNAANEMFRHHNLSVSPTRGGSVMMLAKLLDDGIGLDYLDQECKNSSFSICAELPSLHEERRKSENSDSFSFFLWGGPLEAAGGWEGVRKYAGSVVAHCLFHYPGRFVIATALDFSRQSVRLGTGEGIVRYEDRSFVAITLKSNFPSAVYDEFQRSRQQSGSLDFAQISKLHICIVMLSVAILGALAKSGYTADTKFAATIFMLLVGFFANALVMGTLGHPYDRYQNRVSCLIPLAAIMVVVYRLKAVESADRATATEVI
jgi:hypothetical protein